MFNRYRLLSQMIALLILGLHIPTETLAAAGYAPPPEYTLPLTMTRKQPAGLFTGSSGSA